MSFYDCYIDIDSKNENAISCGKNTMTNSFYSWLTLFWKFWAYKKSQLKSWMQFEELRKSLRFLLFDRLLRLLDYQVPCHIVINTKDVVSLIHAKSYILHRFLTIGKIWKTCAEPPTRKRIVESILLK